MSTPRLVIHHARRAAAGLWITLPQTARVIDGLATGCERLIDSRRPADHGLETYMQECVTSKDRLPDAHAGGDYYHNC